MYISLVLIGAFAIYNWLAAPHKNYIMAAQKYEQVTSKLEKKNQKVLHNLKLNRKELKSIQAKFSQANKTLFNPIQVQEFFDNIPSLVQSTGCNLEQLTFLSKKSSSKKKSSKPDTGIRGKSARLVISGDYGNITKTLNKLQDHQQKVYIDEIKINPDRNKKTILKCDMNIVAYVIYK
jgi:Tfp pilus assembly protein PilO